MSHNWQSCDSYFGVTYIFFYKYVICLQSFHTFVKHHAPSAIYLAYRCFNPWYQDVSTLTCSDISTHDIKTFQPLHVQTFQPMISRRFNPYIFSHFNPCFEHFQRLFLRLVNHYIEDVSTLVKPIFTGKKCYNCPIQNLYTVYTTRARLVRWLTTCESAVAGG